MDNLLELLTKLLPQIDFKNEIDLVDEGILDSLDIVSIISEITTEYDIEIPAEEITPENFNSATSIYQLVEKLMEDE